MLNNKDPEYFPLNYNDSRQRFSTLIQKVGGDPKFESWAIPSKSSDDLFVDSAYWGPISEPKFLLVMTSGIHGSESYAGSAILQMFLTEFFPQLNREHLGVLLVHSMNPYGFKHHKRTTENGVNLNRNFSISGDLFKLRNTESEKIHERFFQYEKVSSPKSKLMSFLELRNGKAYFQDLSLDEFTKATAVGQFKSPKDIEYGGKNLEPQSVLLIKKLQELLPLYHDVLGLDLHTGIGDQNRLHLLTSGSGKDLHPELFAKLFNAEADKNYYEHTPASAEGFYDVHGDLSCAFSDIARDKQRVCAITMEFGTLGNSLEAQLKGINNFIVELQGSYHGYATSELEEQIRKECFERSYPQNDEWRKAVVGASRGLMMNVFRRAGFYKL